MISSSGHSPVCVGSRFYSSQIQASSFRRHQEKEKKAHREDTHAIYVLAGSLHIGYADQMPCNTPGPGRGHWLVDIPVYAIPIIYSNEYIFSNQNNFMIVSKILIWKFCSEENQKKNVDS